MSLPADPSLALPRLPPLDQPLGPLDSRRRRTRSLADARPFRVAGRAACVVGSGTGGIRSIHVHPYRLVCDIGVQDARLVDLVETPLGVERRLELSGSKLVERIVVPVASPACVIEWATAVEPVEVELVWTFDSGAASPALRWRANGRGILAQADTAAGSAKTLLAFSRPPLELTTDSTTGPSGLRFRARFRIQQEDPLRLAITGGSDPAVLERALTAAARTAVVLGSRRALEGRLARDGLRFEAADPSIGEALLWARIDLASDLTDVAGGGRVLLTCQEGFADPRPRVQTPTVVAMARAALAAGDLTVARDVLTTLARLQTADGTIPEELDLSGATGSGTIRATRHYLRLVAEYVAWTGDLATVRALWPGVLRAVARADVPPGLRIAADSLGGEAEAARLREAVRPQSAASQAAEQVEREEAEEAEQDLAPELEPILRVAHDVLGAEPDAPRGRLVLRVRPPPDLDGFLVRGLAVGEARVSVSYRREGKLHRLTLRQDRGASPLRVVLEPALPAGALRAARVDGERASLDARLESAGLVCPVQVVLDHERTIELEVE